MASLQKNDDTWRDGSAYDSGRISCRRVWMRESPARMYKLPVVGDATILLMPRGRREACGPVTVGSGRDIAPTLRRSHSLAILLLEESRRTYPSADPPEARVLGRVHRAVTDDFAEWARLIVRIGLRLSISWAAKPGVLLARWDVDGVPWERRSNSRMEPSRPAVATVWGSRYRAVLTLPSWPRSDATRRGPVGSSWWTRAVVSPALVNCISVSYKDIPVESRLQTRLCRKWHCRGRATKSLFAWASLPLRRGE